MFFWMMTCTAGSIASVVLSGNKAAGRQQGEVIKVKFVPFKRYKVKLGAPCQVGSSASFISLHKGLKLSRAETSGNTIEVTIKLTRQQVVILRYESPCTF